MIDPITISNPYGEDWVMSSASFTSCLTVAIVGFLLLYGLSAFLMGRIFRKAGVPAWKAWVPVYNLWKFFQIGGYAGGLALLPVIMGGLIMTSHMLLIKGIKDWTSPSAVTLCIAVPICVIVAIIFTAKYFLALWSITKKLGKNWVYILLYFVNLGPSLWLWVLALDKSKWNDKLGKKSLAPEMLKKKK